MIDERIDNEEFVDNTMDVVTLTDDEGNEHEFELLGSVELDGDDNEYIVLAEIIEDEILYDDPLICRIVDEEEESILYPVDDEDVIEKIIDKFNEMSECDCGCEHDHCDCDGECDCDHDHDHCDCGGEHHHCNCGCED